MSNGRLARLFLSATPAAATQIDPDTLERELRSRIDAARAAWSEGWGDEDSFVLCLARHTRARLPAVERAADITWLACACASGCSSGHRDPDCPSSGGRSNVPRRRIQRRASPTKLRAQVVFTSLLVRDRREARADRCLLPAARLRPARRGSRRRLGARHDQALSRARERPHDSVAKVTHGAAEHQPDLVLLRSRGMPGSSMRAFARPSRGSARASACCSGFTTRRAGRSRTWRAFMGSAARRWLDGSRRHATSSMRRRSSTSADGSRSPRPSSGASPSSSEASSR